MDVGETGHGSVVHATSTRKSLTAAARSSTRCRALSEVTFASGGVVIIGGGGEDASSGALVALVGCTGGQWGPRHMLPFSVIATNALSSSQSDPAIFTGLQRGAERRAESRTPVRRVARRSCRQDQKSDGEQRWSGLGAPRARYWSMITCAAPFTSTLAAVDGSPVQWVRSLQVPFPTHFATLSTHRATGGGGAATMGKAAAVAWMASRAAKKLDRTLAISIATTPLSRPWPHSRSLAVVCVAVGSCSWLHV